MTKTTLTSEIDNLAEEVGYGRINIVVVIQEGRVKRIEVTEKVKQIKIEEII